ncbi:MFS transporter [Lindgomyces ingoldianus]|uniref:MFS transporter n=1 Tax=Lindgomyces ingoldianus TaxID=673940 RepID=A0ACB6QVV9_9PLEO|nr:MFS transporter [Lindgomyces ingoldianus]KAF2470708.1 MFS transporter [Lindgomyces ingoldianus]
MSKGRDTGIKDNWKCILICLAMSLANCQYGYDTATIAGFQAMVGFLKIYGYKDKKAKIGWNIHTTPQQLISSFLNIGTIIGVVLTHLWGRRFGRRQSIWLASLISFVAAGLQVGSEHLVGLYFGRILIGISNGFFITFANVYTAEVSPPHLRGSIVSFFGIWVNIGSMLGAIANNFSKDYKSKLCYQIPLASLYAIPFMLSILMAFLPESPRWLLVQGRPDQARQALERLRGNSFKNKPELLEEEFLEMKRGIEEEKSLATGSARMPPFKGTDLRRTMICFAVILSHSSSGVWLVIGYGTFFFQMAGVDKPFLATILKSFMGFLGVCLGMSLSYKVIGRRFSMLLGHGGAAVFMLGMGIAHSVAPESKEAGKAIVACALLYHFTYNGFSGALSWPVANELVSSRLRVITIGVGTGINYVFAWLTSFTTPYFINSSELNWGAKASFLTHHAINPSATYFYFFLPEMRNRSLEEIDEIFNNKVATFDFPKYQCVSSERAKELALKNIGADRESVAGKEKQSGVELRETMA